MKIAINWGKVKNYLLMIPFTIHPLMYSTNKVNKGNINDQILGMIWLACCCFWPFFVFLFFLSNLFAAFWIYFDAKKLNLEDPLIWVILSLFSFPFGFVIYYFFVRRNCI